MKIQISAVLLAALALLLSAESSGAKSKKPGISGNYHCSCFSGITVVKGTCSTKARSNGSVECGKHEGDTCTATCKMVTFQKGATGGSIAIQPGTKAPGTRAAPGMMQKAR